MWLSRFITNFPTIVNNVEFPSVSLRGTKATNLEAGAQNSLQKPLSRDKQTKPQIYSKQTTASSGSDKLCSLGESWATNIEMNSRGTITSYWHLSLGTSDNHYIFHNGFQQPQIKTAIQTGGGGGVWDLEDIFWCAFWHLV